MNDDIRQFEWLGGFAIGYAVALPGFGWLTCVLLAISVACAFMSDHEARKLGRR